MCVGVGREGRGGEGVCKEKDLDLYIYYVRIYTRIYVNARMSRREDMCVLACVCVFALCLLVFV